MKALLGKLGGRKFVVILLQLVFCALVGFGIDLSEETRATVIQWSTVAVGMYLGGQSLADGLSKGETSTTKIDGDAGG